MRTVEERFFEKIQFVDKWYGPNEARTRCLEWTGCLTHGYGQFAVVSAKRIPTHRWLYERWWGPIAESLEIDHLCRNRACCNPTHLEPVTPQENLRRRSIVNRPMACPLGHPYTEDNIFVRSDRPASLDCITCRAIRKRRYRTERKRIGGGSK
jgi:hypothetical protein